MEPKDIELLKKVVGVACSAREHGNHPFGALLADPDGNVLFTAENTVVTSKDSTGHAETNLMRIASTHFDKAFLRKCTIYSSSEPCPMCSGAIYWTGIGRLVYAMSEAELLEMTGINSENPTCTLPCREVLSSGQYPIQVEGPTELACAREAHHGYWHKNS